MRCELQKKNRSSRARGQALANIQAHLEYLERTLEQVNQSIEQLNQNERLVERGKSKKLALTACVRKMLVILTAMVRAHRPWQTPDLSLAKPTGGNRYSCLISSP